MSAMHKEESTTGIVVAGFMDLVLDGIILVEKKKLLLLKICRIDWNVLRHYMRI